MVSGFRVLRLGLRVADPPLGGFFTWRAFKGLSK